MGDYVLKGLESLVVSDFSIDFNDAFTKLKLLSEDNRQNYRTDK